MSEVLYIELDTLPVSTNDMWMPALVKGRPAIVKTPKYRAWRKQTAWLIKAQVKGARLVGPYALHVELCSAGLVARDRDCDNYSFKAFSDAAQDAGVIENDSKCVRLKSKWVSGGPAVRAWFISTTEGE